MPVTKSARKKLRKDKKRKIENARFINIFKDTIKKTKKQPSLKFITAATKIIDKAAKKRIIHKNKASRLKSQLAKLLPKSSIKPSSKRGK